MALKGAVVSATGVPCRLKSVHNGVLKHTRSWSSRSCASEGPGLWRVREHPRAASLFPRRLSKFLNHSGYNVDTAKQLCTQGRVAVNGTQREAARIVDPRSDSVTVDGSEVFLSSPQVYVAFNKPYGVVSQFGRDKRRTTLTDYLGILPKREGVAHVGRLDSDTIGLLLLTDDAELNRFISQPGTMLKRYQVAVLGRVCEGCLDELRRGVYLRSIDASVVGAFISNCGAVEDYTAANGSRHRGVTILDVAIREGKYRQVRKMMGYCRLLVANLFRYQVGPLRIGNLEQGASHQLSQQEVDALYEAAGG